METRILNNMDDEGSKQKKTSDRGFLCAYHFYFLPIISLIIWGLFLLK